MAEKQINIRIKTIETELNKSLKKIEKLEGIITKLNSKQLRLKTTPAQRAAERLRKEIEKGNQIVTKFFDPSKATGFGNSIKNVSNEVNSVRKAFEAATSASDRQERASALIAGNFKKMRMEAVAFAQATGKPETMKGAMGGSVQTRLKEIRGFPKTILAGREAMGLLNKMLELAEVNSKDFLDINKAIGKQLKINAEMQKAADLARGKKVEKGVTSEKRKQRQLESDLLRIRQKRIKLQERELTQQRRATEKARRQRQQTQQGRMLGAGFPLLFGGGAGSVVGSLAGSLLAPPGMEFGAQIFGSAIGTQLEAVHNRVVQIGNATQTLDLEALEQSGIRVNAELELQIRHLKKIGDFQKAQEAINKQVFWTTGAWGDVNKDIANNVGALQEAWNSFLAAAGTTLGIIVAPFITSLTAILKLTQGILWAINVIFSFSAKIIKEVTKFFVEKLPFGSKILEIIVKHMENMNKQLDGMKVKYGEIMQDLEAEKEAILLRIKYGEREAAIRQRIKDLSHLATTPTQKKELESAIRKIADLNDQLMEQQKEVQRLDNLYKSIGQTIENGLVNAIEGAINGTKTLGDVARSVFSEIQRSLIRFGVNSLLGGIPGFGKFFRANGGPVSAGKSYVVGERGPELFTPNAGGRITSNENLNAGSTNIAINVEASGSSVEGDEQKGRELGQMLSAAIQSELIKQRRPGGLLT